MRFLSVNSDSFLIELSSLEETLALYSKLQNLHLNGIKDLIPAAKTILICFNEIKTDFKTLSVLIGTLNLDSGFDRNTQEVIIPIPLRWRRFSTSGGTARPLYSRSDIKTSSKYLERCLYWLCSRFCLYE